MITHYTRDNKFKKGSGLFNKLINKLPFEIHIPGYKFCGPGTDLQTRLAREDVGINSLDAACREHDIAYSQSEELSKRHEADKILADKAWKRFKAKDSSFGEKIAGMTVAGLMKGKRKLGMGLGAKKGGKLRKKRILKPPKKIGGFLPLLFPLLGALGALGGGAAGIAKAVNDAKADREKLEELRRHNKAIEVSKGKGLKSDRFQGKGLFLKPYKGGKVKNLIKKKSK